MGCVCVVDFVCAWSLETCLAGVRFMESSCVCLVVVCPVDIVDCKLDLSMCLG